MKKLGIIVIFIVIFVIAIFAGVSMYKSTNKIEKNKETKNNITNETIVNQINYSVKNDITITTNTEEEKISPKATLTIKKQYTQCGHVINEYKEIPEELVNLTKKELEGRCENYEIEKFSTLSIILQKEESGFCGEHYILKQKDDVIAVYKIKEDGTQSLEDVTGICVEYLTENDKMQIKKGITVYGKEELNSMLEDYE